MMMKMMRQEQQQQETNTMMTIMSSPMHMFPTTIPLPQVHNHQWMLSS